MRILSYNIRGLGVGAKRRNIRELISKEKIEFACFQEIKTDRLSDGE